MLETTAVLDALPVAVYATDAEGLITYYNNAAAELWGRRPLLNRDKWCGSLRLYNADGSPLSHEECPMAQTLKRGEAVRGATAILEREDGARIPFMPYPTLLRGADGQVTGAVNVLADISERRRAEQESARLAAIVTTSDDAILSKSLDGVILSWNAGAQRIFGYEAAEMVGQSIFKIIPPDLHGEERHILAQLSQGERVDHYETTRIAKDGRRLHISLSVAPLKDQNGRVVGASKIARDITERKRHEQMLEYLVRELNHRVKNSLATVQGIANQTLRYSDSREEFVATFNRRIRAFARAHSLLLRQKLQGAELSELLRAEISGDNADERISYDGPLVSLDPDLTLQLALVLHELAANAHEFGALSAPEGRLAVSWEVESKAGERRLMLHWRESGGPRVTAPTGRGFGSQMIEKGLAAYRGEASLSFGADGVSCDIEVPLADVAIEQERPAVEDARVLD
ncbi:MAG TPA: PAS domain S-box protein, partial [Caulobacterales bacterium]|nr:PAS domain S-box protein [Caulobacterales bacterium]